MKDAIGIGELQKLIGVDRERLRVWIDRGVFGRDKVRVGAGRPGRQFSLADALLARCLRELLDLTGTIRGLLREGEMLRALRQEVRSLLDVSDEPVWLIVVWSGKSFDITESIGGPQPTWQDVHNTVGFPCAFVVLPFHEFRKGMKKYFERVDL